MRRAAALVGLDSRAAWMIGVPGHRPPVGKKGLWIVPGGRRGVTCARVASIAGVEGGEPGGGMSEPRVGERGVVEAPKHRVLLVAIATPRCAPIGRG